MRRVSPLSQAFGILLVVSAASWAPAPLRAETPVSVGPFRSVTLRSGGKVILRHASEPQVNVRMGSTDVTHVEIVGRDRLVIDHPNGCPKGSVPAVPPVPPTRSRGTI